MENNSKKDSFEILPIDMWPGFGNVEMPKFKEPRDLIKIIEGFWKEEDKLSKLIMQLAPIRSKEGMDLMGTLHRMRQYTEMIHDIMGYFSRALREMDGEIDILGIIEEGEVGRKKFYKKYDEEHGTN